MIPYLDDWLFHHPDRQVLLRHQVQLIKMLDLVGFILNRKKSELDLTQDIQFLGIRLRFDLGKALLTESKAREIVACTHHLSSLRILTYSQVSQLMGSLNWASDLRPLQYYFHSLGLTNRFAPPRRSDPLVLANLLRQWQDPCFLTSGIPIRPFQVDFTIFTDASQISGTSSESANSDRVVPSPRDSETYLQGMGDTIDRHVRNSVEFPPSSVHVSNSGPKSLSGGCSVSGLAGEVNVHVSPIPPAQQSHSEAPSHSEGRGDPHCPLVAESVVVSTPTSLLCGTDITISLPSRSSVPAEPEVHFGKNVLPSARMEALMRRYNAAGFSQEVSRLAAAPRRPSTNRMYDDSWLRFARWAAGQGFDPLNPSASQVASFLFTLFDTHGLSPETVKGYRTCIGSVLNRTGKAKVVLHKTISGLIASMELQRPRAIVLEGLSKSPYEPLREASFKYLTLKTVFLLAMASAGRRSEIHAQI